MTTINITLPDSITVKGGGFESSVEVSRITDAALVAVFEYGLGRIVQDNVNGRAKALRDERGLAKGTKVAEAEGYLAERIKSLYDGTVAVRANSGMSDVEKVAHQIAKRDLAAAIESQKGKDAAKAFRAADASETRAKVAAFMEAHADRDWHAEARDEIARRKEEAERRAKELADAMSAVAKAKIDLDAILNS